MKQSVIGKGLLVLVIALMFVAPGTGYAEGDPPNIARDDGSIILQNGETLDPNAVNHLRILLHVYKENGMKKEADIVERMIAGELNDDEVKQLTDSKTKGFPGFIDSDTWSISSTHFLYTYVGRPWWLFGQNEHLGWSGNPTTNGDVPINSIYMRAQAWDSAGVQQYNNYFGFSPASTVYCRPNGPSSGSAKSTVTYQDGSVSITREAEGTY